MGIPSPASRSRAPYSDKAATGLGLVILLLFCSVIIAGVGIHAARSASDNVKRRHLPFMEAALAMEGQVHEAAFHVGMFGISGDMANYSGARILFAAIRETAGSLSRLAPASSLLLEMETLVELAHKLSLVLEKKRTLNGNLAAEQAALEKHAGDIGDILLGLQAWTAAASSATDGGKTLDEKARLLALNGFSLAVAETTGRVLAAGAARSAGDLAKAQAFFAERWAGVRDACRAAAGLPTSGGISSGRIHAKNPAGSMENLVAEYAKALDAIRYNLEESARVSAERAEITGRLTAAARKLVFLVRSDMADAADNTDTALRGAAATLFACALLVCILAAGTAVVFIRSKREQA